MYVSAFKFLLYVSAIIFITDSLNHYAIKWYKNNFATKEENQVDSNPEDNNG